MGKTKKKIFLQRKDFKQPKSTEMNKRLRSRKIAKASGAVGPGL